MVRMQRTPSPGWLMPPPDGSLAVRLAAVPDTLWRHWGLFLLVPAILSVAYLVLLQDVVFDPRVAPMVFTRIAVLQICMTTAGSLLYALIPPRMWTAGRDSLPRIFALKTAVVVAAVVLGGELGMWLFWRIGVDATPGQGRTVIYGLGFVFGMLAQGLAFMYDGLALRAREGELREESARRETLQARLEALQARTNPHFLFNSLNAIAGLIAVDPERAERAIEMLSEVMRYALEGTRRRFVPLSAEVETVRSYLALEQLRHGERLTAAVEVDPSLAAAPVPPLCLQPIVENAVLHGVASREGGGHLEVTGAREVGSLVLRVRDDGPGPGASSHTGTGSALRDLRSRLSLLYGERASLEVRGPEAGGCEVTLRLPVDAARRGAA